MGEAGTRERGRSSMAWEGIVPAVLITGAFTVAAVSLEGLHKLSHNGRVRRTGRDAFDVGLDERDARLVRDGTLKPGAVYGVNEALLLHGHSDGKQSINCSRERV